MIRFLGCICAETTAFGLSDVKTIHLNNKELVHQSLRSNLTKTVTCACSSASKVFLLTNMYDESNEIVVDDVFSTSQGLDDGSSASLTVDRTLWRSRAVYGNRAGPGQYHSQVSSRNWMQCCDDWTALTR